MFNIIGICIDAGHGGKDPGAVSGDWYEKFFTLDIALDLQKKLKKYNRFNVFMTRTNDEFISLSDRCKIANDNNCSLFVSIHINSSANSLASGIETHIYNDSNIGDIFQTKLIEATKAIDRGVKISPLLYVLNSTKMPAVLLELGFINNFNDINNLRKATYRNNLSKAIEMAICKYFNVDLFVLKSKSSGETTINSHFVSKEKFKMVYKTISEIPEYAKDTIKNLVDLGVIKGDEQGNLNLSDEMVRTIIITKRMIKALN